MTAPTPGFWTVLVLLALGAPTAAEPIRLEAPVFDAAAEIEIRGLPRAQAEPLARRALAEIHQLAQLFDPAGDWPGGLGALNAAAGGEPIALDPRVADLLRRGLQFCLWSSGSHGPLGGALYGLWDGGGLDRRLPDTKALHQAVTSADCSRLRLELGEAQTGALAAGTRAAAVGMGRGYALDRAADLLRQAGVQNAWLEIGGLARAFGRGPGGAGWLVSLPSAPGAKEPLDRIYLRDQSLAVASHERGRSPRFIDQRIGLPARGVFLIAAVTELAMDAEALAATLYVTGLREGQLRLGTLQPRPSVYWLLGEGDASPLESTYRWSDLSRVPRAE